jgi:transposase-like protein/transposase
MGQVLHGCARTTAATRREIQHSQESVSALAARLGVNPKTIMKWRKRKDEGVADRSNAPKTTRTKLTAQDEAIICTFRKSMQLPLDDCLDALLDVIPYLTRSALHRCLTRYGLSQLPRHAETQPLKKTFKPYPIGFVHVDITELYVGREKLYLFVAICRICKFAYVELFDRQTAENACLFLNHLVAACPFHIHTILTDNGSQFILTQQALRKKPKQRHRFDRACNAHGIRHRTTKPYRPQTNGQVERFNRTLKEATVNLYHYASKEQLNAHLNDFIIAYNIGKKLSALKRKTPFQAVKEWWKNSPKLFKINPDHQLTGLNT